MKNLLICIAITALLRICLTILDVKGQQGMFFVPESRIPYFCLRRSHLRLLAINLATRTTQFINMTSPVLDLFLSDAALFLSIQL